MQRPNDGVLSAFAEIGEQVLTAWRNAHFNEDAFPGIAEDALGRRALHDSVNTTEVLEWMLGEWCLRGPVGDSAFGQPPVTVFSTDRFYIEVILWFDGTTAIHEHSFSGAFQVLDGSSIHTVYDWRPEQQVNTRLCLGTMHPRTVECLRPGATRAILPGAQLIHSLFHLERPSATVVLRTNADLRYSQQYIYKRPCLAVVPRTTPLAAKKLAALVALHGIDPGLAVSRLCDQLDAADAEYAYRLLETAVSLLGNAQTEQELLPRARVRLGETASSMWTVVLESQRSHLLQKKRARVTDPGHRILLAALLIGDDRDHVFRIVESVVGGDVKARIMGWIRELTRPPEDSSTPHSTLDLEFGDTELELLEGLVDGLHVEGVKKRLADEYGAAEVEENAEHLELLCTMLQRSPVFASLLRTSPVR